MQADIASRLDRFSGGSIKMRRGAEHTGRVPVEGECQEMARHLRKTECQTQEDGNGCRNSEVRGAHLEPEAAERNA